MEWIWLAWGGKASSSCWKIQDNIIYLRCKKTSPIMLSSLSNVNSLAYHTLMSAHNHKRCPRWYIYMWRPLFIYYFILIATMTKTMFVNSQQFLFIILFICELITLHKIHMISLFLFILYLLFYSLNIIARESSPWLNINLYYI